MINFPKYDFFIHLHAEQLKNASIPRLYWSALFEKLQKEIFDAGEYFSLVCKDDDNTLQVVVTTDDGIAVENPNNIFLVDHAWTTEIEYAEKQLQSFPDLRARIAKMFGLHEGGFNDDEMISEILKRMWRYNTSYSMKKEGEEEGKYDRSHVPLWYLMDEFGTAVEHSDEPNFYFKFFYHQDTNTAYTVIFPIVDLAYGDIVTRDYTPGVTTPLYRDARLYVWDRNRLNMACVSDDWTNNILVMKTDENRCSEDTVECIAKRIVPNFDRPLKVYTTDHFSHHHLTDVRFQLVDDFESADILYLANHFKNFRYIEENPHVFVNQYPNECVLTCKDLFAESCRRFVVTKYGANIPHHMIKSRGTDWLPVTFNLTLELPQFIKCFEERKNRNEYNYWIVKPWNLARSIGHSLTNNVDQIIRLSEHCPMVCCEYVQDPVLFYRTDIKCWVKFEFRFQLYIRGLDPVDAFVHEVMYPRFGNKAFEMNNLTEYQRHWTNMYGKEHKLYDLHHDYLIEQFGTTYPHLNWNNIVKDIHQCIRELVEGASAQPPPNGLGRLSQCRAAYGIDVMLKWKDKAHREVQPVLLEANFHPDNWRACRVVPDLMNETYRLLFLNENPTAMIQI